MYFDSFTYRFIYYRLVFSDNKTALISVSWEKHFRNPTQDDGQFLNPIDPFPVQFKDLQDDGILFANKFVAPSLDDNFGSRTLSGIPNKLGIVKFEYGKDSDESKDFPDTWFDAGLNETVEISETVDIGDFVKVFVRATDSMGNKRTDSTLVAVDNTPPMTSPNGVTKLVLNDNATHTNYSFPSRVEFEAFDYESGVKDMTVQIVIQMPGKEDKVFQQPIEANIGKVINSEECYATKDPTMCFIKKQTVFLNNCWFMAPTKADLQGSTATINVIVYNQAGLTRTISFNNIDDLTSLRGLDYEGPRNLRIERTTTNSFRVAWDLPEKNSCYGQANVIITLVLFNDKGKPELISHEVSSTSTYFDVASLKPGTKYEVIYKTQLGGGGTTEGLSLNVVTAEEKEPTNYGPVIGGAVVGVIVLIIIVVVVLVVLIRRGVLATPAPVQRITRAVTKKYRQTFYSEGTSSPRPSKGLHGHRNMTYDNNVNEEELYIYGGMELEDTNPMLLARNDIVLESLLKSGHFANIYKARLRNHNETVVAKTLKEKHSENDAFLMRAKINFTAFKLEDHPNVLKFHGAVMNNEEMGPIIVYEYCENGSLREYLELHQHNVTIELQEKLFRFGLDIAKGMEYLAKRGITHKRLAARNILLTALNAVKIAGFGPQSTEDDGDGGPDKKERIPIKWMAPECTKSTKDASNMQRRKSVAIDKASGCPIRIRHLDDVIDSDTSDVKRKAAERHLRYEHLSSHDRLWVERVLKGGLDLSQLPRQQPNVVRVFVCSSGPDFEAERNYLLESVYPLVRQHCRENHGVDFQMVDMYWGDPSQPSINPYKFDAVLKELQHCQRASMGPNFVAFIGQKYGNPTLPASISTNQMSQIAKALSVNQEACHLLKTFYIEDVNIKPNVYRLQEEQLTNNPEGSAALLDSLLSAVSQCLSQHEAEEFLSSDFECLLQRGILDTDTEADSQGQNCLLYMREIQNIEQHLKAKNSANFVDIDYSDNTWDKLKKNKLIALKDKIEKVVPEENILKTSITLNGCTLDEQTSGEYVSKIGRHFYSSLLRIVEEQLSKKEAVLSDPLVHEVVQQWQHVNSCSSPFIDREEILNVIKGYILSETDQPLVLAGKPGSGKTSIIAKAANDINEAIASENLSMPTVVVTRFVGETENSADIQSFLFNLCHQMAFLTGRYRQDVPKNYTALKNYFIDILQRGEYGGMLVLLIDSLELMSMVNDGHKLEWLPSRIAANIKVIITINSECKNMIQRFENKVDGGVIYQPDFSAADCENSMKQLMAKSNRSVNYNQWKCIQSAFKKCSSPVYANLVFQEVLTWHSFDKTSDNGLPHSVEQLILNFLQRLESKYGRLIISKVIGYLTASRTGYTESELVDIMSIDDDLLNEVYRRNNAYPPLRQFPLYIWCLIRQELEPYLVRKEVDGVAVYTWKDSNFVQVAVQRYCSPDCEESVELFSNISDYYLGTWGGTRRKPFQHQCMLMAKYKLVESNDESCRHLPTQELIKEQNGFVNRRKLSQLPFALKQAKRVADLKSAVFCNFEWLETKLKVSSVQGLISDFSMSSDREVALVGEALGMSKSALAVNPKSLGMELTGRLLPYVPKYVSIKALIRQCDLQGQRLCPLVANCQVYSAPGGPLQYECEVGGDKKCPIDIDVFSSPDGILLTAKPYYSSRLQVWELQNGDMRPDIMLPVGQVIPSRDGRYINIVMDNKTVKFFRSDCGIQHGEVDFGPGKVADIDVSKRFIALVTEKGAGPYVIDIDRNELLHRFTYHTHAVAISDDETYLVFNSETSLLLHELPVMKRKCVATATGIPEDIIFIDQSPKCYILTKSKLVESITFDVISRKFKCKTILTDLDAKQCIASHSKRLVLVLCSKTLHVIDTVHDQVKSRIQKLPPGVFVDNSSSFSGAGFTPDESRIVACRYTYLIIWDANTCAPVRVLQSCVSPMMKLFTSNTINKVVTLLEDNSFQVWNLDNLDRDIQHSIEIHQGAVQSVAVSTEAGMILSHDNMMPDAKLICLDSGKVMDTLQHSEHPGDHIVSVHLSPDGRYAISRACLVLQQNIDNSSFSDLTDDILWEVETAAKVFHASNNRYIQFSPGSDAAAFITCAFHNPLDWSENMYNVFIVHPDTSTNYTIDFPFCSEFVTPPTIVNKDDTNFFIAVIQTSKTSYSHNSSREVARWCEIRLFIQKLSPVQAPDDQELLRLQNMITDVGDLDQFLAALPVSNGNILAVYAKNIQSYPFEYDKGVVPPRSLTKGAVLFNVSKMTALQHFPDFLHAASDVTSIRMSSSYTVMIDDSLRLFSMESCKPLGKLACVTFMKGSVSLALNGRYAVGISSNQQTIIIARTVDDTEIGSVFVHGKATCLAVANDDRTVVVGCEDGRIMIFSLILEFSDPLREYIEKLPSRTRELVDEDNMLILSDVRHISNTTTDQHRLSARLQRTSIMEERRPPSYTTLHRAVTVSRQSCRQRGDTPCVQQ